MFLSRRKRGNERDRLSVEQCAARAFLSRPKQRFWAKCGRLAEEGCFLPVFGATDWLVWRQKEKPLFF
ncbi:hypothetical protein MKY25_01470 [Geobacillus sp. FSL W8-0032]|uniref:hypothetical protein n=1 Tax=Geobacillus TaxID=129337 RepID=UPI00103BB0AE|nr:hypothetical protein [Geobacillus icigianus]